MFQCPDKYEFISPTVSYMYTGHHNRWHCTDSKQDFIKISTGYGSVCPDLCYFSGVDRKPAFITCGVSDGCVQNEHMPSLVRTCTSCLGLLWTHMFRQRKQWWPLSYWIIRLFIWQRALKNVCLATRLIWAISRSAKIGEVFRQNIFPSRTLTQVVSYIYSHKIDHQSWVDHWNSPIYDHNDISR